MPKIIKNKIQKVVTFNVEENMVKDKTNTNGSNVANVKDLDTLELNVPILEGIKEKFIIPLSLMMSQTKKVSHINQTMLWRLLLVSKKVPILSYRVMMLSPMIMRMSMMMIYQVMFLLKPVRMFILSGSSNPKLLKGIRK